MIFKYCISLKISFFVFAISADPDELPHHAGFQLGLHCLPKYSFRSCSYRSSLIWVDTVRDASNFSADDKIFVICVLRVNKSEFSVYNMYGQDFHEMLARYNLLTLY